MNRIGVLLATATLAGAGVLMPPVRALAVDCAKNVSQRAAYLKSLAHRDGKKHTKSAIKRWKLDREATLKRFNLACSTEVGAEGASLLPLLDGDSLEAEVFSPGQTSVSRFELPVEDETLLAALDTNPLPTWTNESEYQPVSDGGSNGGGSNGGFGGYGPGGGIGGYPVGGGGGAIPPVTSVPIQPVAPVPEPGSLMLLGTGLMFAGFTWRQYGIRRFVR